MKRYCQMNKKNEMDTTRHELKIAIQNKNKNKSRTRLKSK